jgi:nucleoside deoxyribosyltransferase
LGKLVIGYADDLRPLRERLRATGPDVDGRYRDAAGHVVEDFGLALNLMLAIPVQLEQGGMEAALRVLTPRSAV